ncbi:MAG TPA: glycosyltransferase family 39 protein [Thermoanaerobaculia bacterium]|nr:glycosyltransferase family 39 protein [Thermoanaerobaculia bacterium]
MPLRLRQVIFAAILAAAAGLAFAQSYGRWLDPIIDTGRDLYIPEQILRGATLYHDVRYQYPPLAPYLLAAITAVTGHSLAAYMVIGVVQSLLIALLLWAIARRAAGEAAAFATALLFLAIDFTGATTWGANFIFPYSYAATLGMLFLLAFAGALYAATFVAQRQSPRARLWLGVAITAGIAASWCKVEYAIAVPVILIVTVIAYRLGAAAIAWFAGAQLAAIAFARWWFHDNRPGYDWIRDNVLAASLTKGETARRFFSLVSGTANWQARTAEALVGAALTAAVVLLLRWRERTEARASRIALAAVVVVVFLALAASGYAFFRGWGLFQVGLLIWALIKDRRTPLLFFATLSAAATLRIPLNVAPFWYGFVLVLPVYLLIVYVLFAYLPSRGVYAKQSALLWMALFLMLAIRDLASQRERWSLHRYPIHAARGVLFDSNEDRARLLDAFFARLGAMPYRTLAVFPEGITIDYLAGAQTPLSFHTFTPVETADAAVEQQVLRELEANPPGRIAIVTRDVTEYGYREFGADYNARLAGWMRAHYHLAADWRAPRFRIVVLER